jgi:hypothetical protein
MNLKIKVSLNMKKYLLELLNDKKFLQRTVYYTINNVSSLLCNLIIILIINTTYDNIFNMRKHLLCSS